MNATSISKAPAHVERLLGIPISIHITDPAAHRHAIDAVFALLQTVDMIFSADRPQSAISRLNRGEVTAAHCRRLVGEIMALCDAARHRTDGYFDAAVRGRGGRPVFDPSVLVKGWAVERAALLLDELGVREYCLSAGANVVVRATAPGAPAWWVEVEDPAVPSRVLAILPLLTGGVATASRPHTALRAVTVVGPSLMWADVYATAALARGADALDWLARQDGYEALATDAAGNIRTTPGMRTLCAAEPANAPLVG
jgi:thiamine biosynthesis lipoprotein